MQCQLVHFGERYVAALQRGVHVRHDRILRVLKRHTRHRDQTAFPHPESGSQPDLAEHEAEDAGPVVGVVADRRVSLATIYKKYSIRDELIITALEEWMEEHRYAGLLTNADPPAESRYGAVMGVFRTIFEPWEQHPRMLEAYWRARTGPGGQRLVRRGYEVVVPAVRTVLSEADAVAFERDLDPILSSLVFALLGRCATGEMKIADALPTLDRAVLLLSAGYEGTRTEVRPPRIE